VIETLALGSTSIIPFDPLGFDLESEPLTKKPSAQPQVTTWSGIIQCCAKGFYGTQNIFPCPSSSSHFPCCIATWTGFLDSGHIFSIPCYVDLACLFPASVVRILPIQNLTSSS
jgi:hypothetical protein